MNYETIVELLLFEFPRLKEKIEAEDYLTNLPHCIFEIILLPYVRKICDDFETKELVKLGAFLEQMAVCEDGNVRELLNVSFLEPMVLGEKEMLSVLRNFLGEITLVELDYWENRYGI